VHLLVSLAGPAPSGSTDTSRLCQGCFPPSPASPGPGCPQLQSSRCDGLTVKSFHLHTVTKRLVAHGFRVPHLRDTTGVGALSTPGTAVLSPARCRARPAPAASQRPVPAPRNRIPPAGPLFTRHQRGFTRSTRPVCPWPAASRMGRETPGSPLCSAPRRYRRRTTGRGRAVSTRPELRDRHNRPSNPRIPSHSATSGRNGQKSTFGAGGGSRPGA